MTKELKTRLGELTKAIACLRDQVKLLADAQARGSDHYRRLGDCRAALNAALGSLDRLREPMAEALPWKD